VPNFVTNLLEGRQVSPEEEDEIKWAASSLYSGGADTVRVHCLVDQWQTDSHILFVARLRNVVLPPRYDDVPRNSKEMPGRTRLCRRQ
jgi:hypothetical protein